MINLQAGISAESDRAVVTLLFYSPGKVGIYIGGDLFQPPARVIRENISYVIVLACGEVKISRLRDLGTSDGLQMRSITRRGSKGEFDAL
jgi:hypothetical protein